MEMILQIPFDQLLTAIKTLTPNQKAILKQKLNDENSGNAEKAAFIETLLKGPVYTEKEIQTIEDNRKSIAKWRTKP